MCPLWVQRAWRNSPTLCNMRSMNWPSVLLLSSFNVKSRGVFLFCISHRFSCQTHNEGSLWAFSSHGLDMSVFPLMLLQCCASVGPPVNHNALVRSLCSIPGWGTEDERDKLWIHAELLMLCSTSQLRLKPKKNSARRHVHVDVTSQKKQFTVKLWKQCVFELTLNLYQSLTFLQPFTVTYIGKFFFPC